MARGKPVIALKNVKKTFITGDIETPVLHGVTLDILAGEFVSLMGPSGSGKSTLMHIMGFLDRMTSGSYAFKGRSVAGLADDELAAMRREEVGFIFQFFNLLARSTVIENVMLPMLYTGIPRAERVEKARAVLEKVGLAHRVDFPANRISGGERQRVAIARALVNEPTVLFADEPTGNLDSKAGLTVLQLFQQLHKEGHTIVMVTHELEAAEFSQRIVSMRDGVIQSDKMNRKRRTTSFTK